jgi:16S rRNA (guanine527-N7)-methyltransferase
VIALDEDLLAGLQGLAARYGLGVRQREQLALLLSGLDAHERAPTAVHSPRRAIDVHIADGLVALELELVRNADRIADLGAGAGFPGLALAVALPGAAVHLVESQRRKCAFMEGLCATAEIANARVACTRAEEWGEGLGRNAVVVARALAAQPVVLEYAAPLLRLGGGLVDWRGRRAEAEEAMSARAADELGLRLLEIRKVEPFAGTRDHHLHVYLKVRDTPDRFPRRAGVAHKRPLGR